MAWEYIDFHLRNQHLKTAALRWMALENQSEIHFNVRHKIIIDKKCTLNYAKIIHYTKQQSESFKEV